MPVYEVLSGEQTDWHYDEPPEDYYEWCVVTAKNKSDARSKGVKAFRRMKCDFVNNGENPYSGMKVTQVVDVPEHTEMQESYDDPFGGKLIEVTVPLYTVADFVRDMKADSPDYWFDFMEEWPDE